MPESSDRESLGERVRDEYDLDDVLDRSFSCGGNGISSSSSSDIVIADNKLFSQLENKKGFFCNEKFAHKRNQGGKVNRVLENGISFLNKKFANFCALSSANLCAN